MLEGEAPPIVEYVKTTKDLRDYSFYIFFEFILKLYNLEYIFQQKWNFFNLKFPSIALILGENDISEICVLLGFKNF